MSVRSHAIAALVAALLTTPITAKTDLGGCVSSETVAYGGASLIWYVPGTGEICSFLDCGGGRAPPKTTVPGCAGYSGTATYSPSFLDLAPSTTSAAAGSTQTSFASSTPVSTITSSESAVTVTADTTSITGTSSPTVTSVATTSTTAASAAASVSSSTATAASASSSIATAAGAMVTVGPIGMVVGLAAGCAAMLQR
ncbi:putative siderophore biosynthesis enzyme [Xylariales sp. AK1849]|nr:putative siderophore biosynthesis enzyme [Xylariales sp. AK1849]